MQQIVRVWAIWLLAPLLITVVHEAEHLIAATIAGAHPHGMVVGPFGGGYALYEGDLSTAGELLALSGGIVINLATGIVALWLSKRFRLGTWLATSMAVLGGLSLVGVACYVFIGVAKGLGDPGRIARILVPDLFSFAAWGHALGTFLIIASAVGCLLATWICARSFVRHQHAFLPCDTKMKRIILAAVLVAPLPLMVGLRACLYDPSGLTRQAFSTGPRATMAILAEIQTTEPDLDDAERFERLLQVIGQRRALGHVDNRPGVAWGTIVMAAGMCLVGGLAAAKPLSEPIVTCRRA